MTDTDRPISDEAERIVRDAMTDLTRPHTGECLCCYVARMLEEFGCNGTHRLALHYRDTMAPRATALLRRLGAAGACCCDCEMFLNAYELAGEAVINAARRRVDPDAEEVQLALPACAGVRPGSVRACRQWLRRGRGLF